MKLSAGALYALALLFVLIGLPAMVLPLIGAPLLLVGYLCYLAAGKAKRKARELEVRRQLGG